MGEAVRNESNDTPVSYSIVNWSPPTLDKGNMAATCCFATPTRDRQGDILVMEGLDTSFHERNPIVLIEHGEKGWPLPIGKCKDAAGNYTVEVMPEAAYQTTYFSQSCPMAEQVYTLIEEGILGANSFGYRIRQARPLPADRAEGLMQGQLLVNVELCEISWVGVPANGEAVEPILSKGLIRGRRIEPALWAMLSPYRQKKKVWSNGIDKRMDLSTLDQGNGGALVEQKAERYRLKPERNKPQKVDPYEAYDIQHKPQGNPEGWQSVEGGLRQPKKPHDYDERYVNQVVAHNTQSHAYNQAMDDYLHSEHPRAESGHVIDAARNQAQQDIEQGRVDPHTSNSARRAAMGDRPQPEEEKTMNHKATGDLEPVGDETREDMMATDYSRERHEPLPKQPTGQHRNEMTDEERRAAGGGSHQWSEEEDAIAERSPFYRHEYHEKGMEGDNDLPGASALRKLHGNLCDLHTSYSEAFKRIEQPKVRGLLEKMCNHLQSHMEGINEIFGSVYPDHKPLGQKAEPDVREGEEAYETKAGRSATMNREDVERYAQSEGNHGNPEGWQSVEGGPEGHSGTYDVLPPKERMIDSNRHPRASREEQSPESPRGWQTVHGGSDEGRESERLYELRDERGQYRRPAGLDEKAYAELLRKEMLLKFKKINVNN